MDKENKPKKRIFRMRDVFVSENGLMILDEPDLKYFVIHVPRLDSTDVVFVLNYKEAQEFIDILQNKLNDKDLTEIENEDQDIDSDEIY